MPVLTVVFVIMVVLVLVIVGLLTVFFNRIEHLSGERSRGSGNQRLILFGVTGQFWDQIFQIGVGCPFGAAGEQLAISSAAEQTLSILQSARFLQQTRRCCQIIPGQAGGLFANLLGVMLRAM